MVIGRRLSCRRMTVRKISARRRTYNSSRRAHHKKNMRLQSTDLTCNPGSRTPLSTRHISTKKGEPEARARQAVLGSQVVARLLQCFCIHLFCLCLLGRRVVHVSMYASCSRRIWVTDIFDILCFLPHKKMLCAARRWRVPHLGVQRTKGAAKRSIGTGRLRVRADCPV